jgi:hypothetical protein
MSALQTAAFFEQRKKSADYGAFLKILNRKGGEAPRPGDELE